MRRKNERTSQNLSNLLFLVFLFEAGWKNDRNKEEKRTGKEGKRETR